ncbi:hypothetical protein [Dapis sp. BLCC M229]
MYITKGKAGVNLTLKLVLKLKKN